jgi:bifunctional UDP-N-acetylglucosamine pyrophosphorylase/glucosamine-1-phosphate N-acetyltransferase
MTNPLTTTQLIIMAAGKGTRMESHLPKVLVPVLGKPIIRHLIDTVKEMNFNHPPIIVVGYEKEQVMAELKEDNVLFAHQDEQLGTAHAVQCALPQIHPDVERVLIINGDHPFTPSEPLITLDSTQKNNLGPVSLGTVMVNDQKEFMEHFYNLGRIIRDENGDILEVVEKKDASPEQLTITEINVQYWCVDVEWLKTSLQEIKNNNAAGEYYLPDLLKITQQQKLPVGSYTTTDTRVAYGINNKKQLADIEERFGKHA